MTDTGHGTGRLPILLGALAAAAFAAGPLLATTELVRPMTGFAIFVLGGLLGFVTLVLALASAVRRGLAAAGPALVLGLVVTGTVAALGLPAWRVPRINDITTDPANPPPFVVAVAIPENQGRDLRYPGPEVAAQQQAAYPDLAGLPLDLQPDAAFQKVLGAARQMPDWELTRNDPTTRTLEGVATSRWFRFRDDFVIEVRPDGDRSVVHMRSKSRDGRSDLGANAARIRAFFAKLRE